MPTIDDIRTKARRALHKAMRVRALYYENGKTTDTPRPIWPRRHYKFHALGDLTGTSANYAERQEMSPQLLFMLDEIEPANRAVVVTALGEAFRLNNILPPDGLTVTANALRLMDEDAVGFDYPGSEAWPISSWSP